jgi:hypothetical protein
MDQGSEWTTAFSVVAHAAVGCGSAMLSGGNCGRGALAAGISEAANQAGFIGKPGKSLASWGTFKGAAEAGLVGGVAAEITGGKFDDGFTVAAAGYIFNSAAHQIRQGYLSVLNDGFPAAADAARAALLMANPLSIFSNTEYGGLIYQNPDGTYGFTGPIYNDTQIPLLKDSADAVNGYNAPNPDGTSVVGDYHTHGDYSWKNFDGTVTWTGDPNRDNLRSNYFSADDIKMSTLIGGSDPNYRSYLGTPSGVFKVYNPYTKAPPASL